MYVTEPGHDGHDKRHCAVGDSGQYRLAEKPVPTPHVIKIAPEVTTSEMQHVIRL